MRHLSSRYKDGRSFEKHYPVYDRCGIGLNPMNRTEFERSKHHYCSVACYRKAAIMGGSP